MGHQLTEHQLVDLFRSVFRPDGDGEALTLLMDVPREGQADSPEWKDRRAILLQWFGMLVNRASELPVRSVECFQYDDVGSNNNDLPATARPLGVSGKPEGYQVPLKTILEKSTIVVAMTEYSATAPLKVLGKELGFRGATMPGFSRKMMPALGLDYDKINDKVVGLKKLMDRSVGIEIILETASGMYETYFDTRFREGHASGGLMRGKGVVGNLPSGEAYIVPYEGERQGVVSLSAGILPVQFGDEIVLYEIRQNRASGVISEGDASADERSKIRSEPAYANIAEIGIGVLGQWGVEACGNTLLDEKLGLHVAFGRSDHFGGATSPASFRQASNVVHIDRVYVPSVQPDVRVRKVVFDYGSTKEDIIVDDKMRFDN